MEKTTAYFLIILSAIVIYSFSSSYTGQIARNPSSKDYVTSLSPGGQLVYTAPQPSRDYIPRQQATQSRPKSLTLTGNTTNATNHTACLFNTCTVVSGPGSNQCWPVGSSCGVTVAPIVNCVDTDTNNYPTINFFVRGTATQNSPFYASYTDTCNTQILLKEYYCNSPTGTISPMGVNCTQFNMTCSAGRCL